MMAEPSLRSSRAVELERYHTRMADPEDDKDCGDTAHENLPCRAVGLWPGDEDVRLRAPSISVTGTCHV
jgi:hypothetical protein